ncbi:MULTISPECIES: LysR family transcriptional regulator [Limibacillus]|jgi:DNA-binding transcriptional LysR family regulator|uniref:DNA-binding transcriptional LysR family regulator n=1 Tax=Limibacillus halophilus TaxID=1579333 RepID=A0A839SM28_9PROT|nr:LysR family transcriptional regulator [Limibacillus halophilus]MBB3063881.1 DNA-binding transcriptional LysR family regulator [Limibacillus halophilus]
MDSFAQLALFVEVADAGSLSAAARKLNVTPSAVSKQIAHLEDRLGARLFHRTTRRLSLTDEGRAFHQRARQLVADLAEAEDAVRDLRKRPSGRLTVEVPVIFGRRWIVPLCEKFLKQNPDVTLDLRLNDRIVDLVAEGVDLVVRTGTMRDSSLVARRLSTNRRLVVASPAYLEKYGRPTRPEELVDHDCIVHTVRSDRYYWRFLDENENETAVTVSGRFEVNDVEAVMAAARSGLGVAQLPVWLVASELEAGRLEQLLPHLHAPEGEIFALYPHSRHLSPKVRTFLDLLVDRFAHGQEWWSVAEV